MGLGYKIPLINITKKAGNMTIKNTHNMTDGQTFVITYTKKDGEEVLKQFENGFKDARVGQYLDTKLKQNPVAITDKELDESYKKYRSVMGTAGSNMALSRQPLGEIFRIGMGKASESVGCGNEIEDSIRDRAVKIPSWPLYYSLSTNDVNKGFELTMERSQTYLGDARKALELLPENFSHRPFLEFLFLTVEHYNEFWFKRLQKENNWSDLETKLPKRFLMMYY